MRLISNVRVGRRQGSPAKPTHTAGVRQGNAPKGPDRQPGLFPVDSTLKGSARRSTGINARDREPIDPRSPNLSPA